MRVEAQREFDLTRHARGAGSSLDVYPELRLARQFELATRRVVGLMWFNVSESLSIV
jgi:hypothetical protein